MTVAELMQELESLDPTLEVHIAYNYGDYWRTTVAPAVREVEETMVIHSDYHSMDKIAGDDDFIDESEREETGARIVVVIK